MTDCFTDETLLLAQEYKWLLNDEVKKVFTELQLVLTECRKRFILLSSIEGEDSLVKSEKFVLAGLQNAQNQTVKCILTLMGCDILEADLTLRIPQPNQSTRIYKTGINPETPWRLQQIQDAGNFILTALELVKNVSTSTEAHPFESGSQVIKLLDEILVNLSNSKLSIVMPKRKSNEDLLKNKYLTCLRPALPKDLAFSFYVYTHKLVLAVYQFSFHGAAAGGANTSEVLQRHQVECMVPWLNESLILLTFSMQRCIDLKDKLEQITSIVRTSIPSALYPHNHGKDTSIAGHKRTAAAAAATTSSVECFDASCESPLHRSHHHMKNIDIFSTPPNADRTQSQQQQPIDPFSPTHIMDTPLLAPSSRSGTATDPPAVVRGSGGHPSQELITF